jgi:hypothetical protein
MTEAEWLASGKPRDMISELWLREAGFPMHGGVQTVYWRPSSERKLRLFNVACCRLIWPLVPEGLYRETVAAAERLADGGLPQTEREELERRLDADFARMDAAVQSLYASDQVEARRLDRYDNGCVEVAVWETLCDKRAVDMFPHVHEMVAVHQAGCGRECFDLEHQVGTAADMAEEERERAANNLSQRIGAAKGIHADILRCVWGNPFRPVTFDPTWRTSMVVALAQATYEERILPAGNLEPDRLGVLADALEDAGCDNADVLGHLRRPEPHVRGCWVVDLALNKA